MREAPFWIALGFLALFLGLPALLVIISTLN